MHLESPSENMKAIPIGNTPRPTAAALDYFPEYATVCWDVGNIKLDYSYMNSL